MNLGIALGAVAIVVSIFAAWMSLHAQRELIRAETVRATFDGFRRVSELRIDCWQAAHVLETPENYAPPTSSLPPGLSTTLTCEFPAELRSTRSARFRARRA